MARDEIDSVINAAKTSSRNKLAAKGKTAFGDQAPSGDFIQDMETKKQSKRS